MTAILTIGGLAVALVVLIIALPCPACRRRRERLKTAYAAWMAERLK